MSTYTTGEIARLCEVSVRTVQFYDAKNLLKPTGFSEGGRRLYSDDDMRTLRLICLLKELGLSLDSIRGILHSENQTKVLLLLLDVQEQQLLAELSGKQKQIQAIRIVRDNLHTLNGISVNSMSDIEKMMNGKKILQKTYLIMLIVGIIMDVIQIGTLIYGIVRGVWWPFIAGMAVVITAAIALVRMYYHNAAYICPECSTKFRPAFGNFFFARHTRKTRKLKCTSCGYNGYCVETHAGDLESDYGTTEGNGHGI